MGYLQRAIQATLTIWLSLAIVIIVIFGLSEDLRVAGVDREANVQIRRSRTSGCADLQPIADSGRFQERIVDRSTFGRFEVIAFHVPHPQPRRSL